MTEFFLGFDRHRIVTSGADINLVTGGSGPPLLLLYGYRQTHLMWRKLAPRFVAEVSVGRARPARVWRQRETARRSRQCGIFQARPGPRSGRGDGGLGGDARAVVKEFAEGDERGAASTPCVLRDGPPVLRSRCRRRLEGGAPQHEGRL